MHTIRAFLKYHTEHETQRLRDESESMSRGFQYLLMAQGVKKAESDWINVWAFQQRAIQLRDAIPKQVAKTYLRLYQEHKLHHWVVKMTPLENMELRAKT